MLRAALLECQIKGYTISPIGTCLPEVCSTNTSPAQGHGGRNTAPPHHLHPPIPPFPRSQLAVSFGFFFGGLAQFCAGLLEYQRRNTFGTVAFCW